MLWACKAGLILDPITIFILAEKRNPIVLFLKKWLHHIYRNKESVSDVQKEYVMECHFKMSSSSQLDIASQLIINTLLANVNSA